jgi:hypothetical protein
MHRTDDTLGGIVEKDRHTIGGAGAQRDTGNIGDESIAPPCQVFDRSYERNLSAVHLFHHHDARNLECSRQPLKAFGDGVAVSRSGVPNGQRAACKLFRTAVRVGETIVNFVTGLRLDDLLSHMEHRN